MNRLVGRAYHLWERIVREGKVLPMRWRVFGAKVALATFRDGLTPPGKSQRYIHTIEQAVDQFLMPLVEEYRQKPDMAELVTGKIPVWCCWWQGVEQMPELVKMCHQRLKQVLPEDQAELHVITLDNYQQYVQLPEHIIDKFNRKIITMTTMSDVLRFALLGKYGGYWLDATVFFTEDIPKEFFSGNFHCQRMASDPQKVAREACRGNWCGFSMAGPQNSIVFQFMSDAFSRWWAHYDTIIDYVLIDYMLWTGFKLVPAIHDVIDKVPDNNPDIFEMYQVLNKPYSPELLKQLTQRNVMHKLTYKMELLKETPEGEQTLYGYLLDWVSKGGT
jgi:hypothetical protein